MKGEGRTPTVTGCPNSNPGNNCANGSRPAGRNPEVVCEKKCFLKVSVSLGGLGPSVAHGKTICETTSCSSYENKAETCSLLDAILGAVRVAAEQL